jgi:hypothetical protein
MSKGMTKAERRAAKKAERRASRALVPVSPKPLATSRSEAHIPSPAEGTMLAFKTPIEYETPTSPFSRSADKLPAKRCETNAVSAPEEKVSGKNHFNWPIAAIAFGFYGVATWINITNAGGIANLGSPMGRPWHPC